MKGATLTCRELIGFLDRYLDGALDERETRLFRGHLDVCPPCRDYLHSYRESIRLARRAWSDGDPVAEGVPEALVEAVLRARAGLSP